MPPARCNTRGHARGPDRPARPRRGARRGGRGTVERPALGDRQRPGARARGGARRARCGGRRLRPPPRAAPIASSCGRGTVDRLGTPTILDRDARHGLDSPTLTYSGHDALLVWRRFRDANTRVLELASVTRAGQRRRPARDHGPAERLQPRLRQPRPADLLAPAGRLHDRDRQPDRRRQDAPAGRRRVRVRGREARRTAGSIAVWPSGGAIFAATRAPGATAFGAATRLSAPGGFARSPQLALTPDGHAVAVWTQSDGTGRALVTAARPPGGAFGAPTTVVALERAGPHDPRAGQQRGRGPRRVRLRARRHRAPGRCAPCASGRPGWRSSSVRTLTPPGERTRDVSLAADGSAGWAAWATGGTTSRHADPRRAHRRHDRRHGPHRLGLRRRGRRPARLRDDAAAAAR